MAQPLTDAHANRMDTHPGTADPGAWRSSSGLTFLIGCAPSPKRLEMIGCDRLAANLVAGEDDCHVVFSSRRERQVDQTLTGIRDGYVLADDASDVVIGDQIGETIGAEKKEISVA